MPTPEAKGTASSRPSPLLIDINALSALLGRSVASLQRDDEAGRIPRPVMLGGSKRWRLKEVRRWVAAGLPSRETWEARFPNLVRRPQP